MWQTLMYVYLDIHICSGLSPPSPTPSLSLSFFFLSLSSSLSFFFSRSLCLLYPQSFASSLCLPPSLSIYVHAYISLNLTVSHATLSPDVLAELKWSEYGRCYPTMMMIAFISLKRSLVPLLWGLVAEIQLGSRSQYCSAVCCSVLYCVAVYCGI